MQADGTRPRTAASWAHLVGVHDTVANKLTLYVNGVEAGSRRLCQASWYAGGAVQIGAGSYDGAARIASSPDTIDDVRLFDRPVSADEVQQLFQQRRAGQGPLDVRDRRPAPRPPRPTPRRPATGRMTVGGGAQAGGGLGR